MTSVDIVKTVILAIFSVSALYSDIRYRKIFNLITIPFFVLGLAFSLYSETYIYIALSVFCFILLFFAKGLGGGDVKFMASLPMFLGFKIINFYIIFLILLILVQIFLKVRSVKSIKLAPVIVVSILLSLLI